MTLTEFLIFALATWRLASLIANEEGPFTLLERLRKVVGVEYNQSEREGKNELARLILCIWCSSVWLGVLWTLLFLFWPGALWLAFPFALSAGAVLVHEVTEWLSDRSRHS